MNCPYCQAPLVPGATFCANCGNNISGATQANQQTQPAQPSYPSSQPQQPAPTPTPSLPPFGQLPAQPGVSGAFAPPMGVMPGQPSGYSMPMPQSGAPIPLSQIPAGMSGSYGAPAQPSGYGMPSQPSGVYVAPMIAPGYAPQGAPPMAYGGQFIDRLFGPTTPPHLAQPYTLLQHILKRTVSPVLSVNRWAMAALGAVVSAVGALALSFGIAAAWSVAIDNALSSESLNSSPTIAQYTSLAKVFLRLNGFQVFALAQHSPLSYTLTANSSLGIESGITLAGTAQLGFPLSGLLLAPMLMLLLGGAISAASDYQRSARYSILRGALIAPVYAVLAALIAQFGSSTTSTNLLVTTFTVTIAASVFQTFLYALLWGAIFGALGGWLHYSGANFLSWGLAVLQRQRNARLFGALAGSATTFAVGFLLSLAVAAGYFIYTFITTSSTSQAAGNSVAGIVGAIIAVVIETAVLGPPIAIGIFSFATGAAITETVNATSSLTISGGNVSAVSSFSLFGSSSSVSGLPASSLPAMHISPAAYLLVLIPLIAYLAGGRVAARVARASAPFRGFIAGALMAIPLSLVMAFLAACTGLALNLEIYIVSESVSYTPDVLQVFLATLIAGAIVGGLGGLSLFFLPQLGALPRWVAVPAFPIRLALAPLFDRLTRRPTIAPRSQSREWLYDGISIGLLLAIVVIAIDIISAVAASLIPFKTLVTIESVVAAVMVGLPLAFFVGSFTSAFTTPTATAAPVPPPIPMPMPQVAPGFTPGFVPGVAPGFAPMQPMQSGAFLPFAMPAQPSMPYGGMAQPMPPAPPFYPPYSPYPPYPPYPGYPGYPGAASGSIPGAPIGMETSGSGAMPAMPIMPDTPMFVGGMGSAPPATAPQALPPSPSDIPAAPPQTRVDQQMPGNQPNDQPGDQSGANQ